jgi:RNA polymerase sigma-70 factor (ECF subfamily)
MGLRKVKPETKVEKIETFSHASVENESILHLDNKPEENNELVLKFLAELKHEQKVCVELMYLQGKSYNDIAKETGYGIKNVKSYIQNGKRNLRIMIEQHNEQ